MVQAYSGYLSENLYLLVFLVAVLILLHRAMDAEGRKAGARARPIV